MNRSVLMAIALLATAVFFVHAAWAGADTSTGDGSWVWQNTTPVGEPLADLRFTSTTQGWALAPQARALIKTTDGGVTWQRNLSLGYKHESTLSAFWFVGSSGWVVGSDLGRPLGQQYLVYRTTNGGANWTTAAMTARHGLADVAFIDATRGWAVGTNAIERTTDGGAHWVKQTVPVASDWTTIAMHDYHTAWVGSSSGKIVATTDGGAHWITQDSGVSGDIRKLSFPTDQTGFGQVGSTVLIATTDGGAHWHQHAMPSWGAVNIDFTGPLWGWATGPLAQVARTTNGGTTWQDQPLVLPPYSLDAVDFLSSSYGWVAGMAGIMARTTDGGDSWTWLSHGVHVANFAVDADGTANVLAVGWVALTSTDAGTTWHSVGTEQIPGMLYAASYPLLNRGWAAGYNGGIYLTTDRGQNWTPKASGTGNDLLGMKMLPDAIHGWVVGAGGTALRTTDGGQTWQAGATDTTMSLRDVDFTDVTHGWAVATTEFPPGTFNSVLLRSTDAGANWTTARTALKERYAAVTFRDADHGWIAGGGDTARVWRTSNGGASWSATSFGPGRLYDVSASSSLDVWVSGADGLVEHSHDGGINWWKEHSGASVGLYSVDFETSKVGWVAGQYGAVLHTTSGGWRNDPVAPFTVAPHAASVVKGAKAALRFEVEDRSDRLVVVVIRIDKAGGHTVKTLQLHKRRTGIVRTAHFVCKLPKGTYTFTVLATDPAGNDAYKMGTNTLKVH